MTSPVQSTSVNNVVGTHIGPTTTVKTAVFWGHHSRAVPGCSGGSVVAAPRYSKLWDILCCAAICLVLLRESATTSSMTRFSGNKPTTGRLGSPLRRTPPLLRSFRKQELNTGFGGWRLFEHSRYSHAKRLINCPLLSNSLGLLYL